MQTPWPSRAISDRWKRIWEKWWKDWEHFLKSSFIISHTQKPYYCSSSTLESASLRRVFEAQLLIPSVSLSIHSQNLPDPAPPRYRNLRPWSSKAGVFLFISPQWSTRYRRTLHLSLRRTIKLVTMTLRVGICMDCCEGQLARSWKWQVVKERWTSPE